MIYHRQSVTELNHFSLLYHPQYVLIICLFLARKPPAGHGFLIHEVSRSHITTHHSRWDSSGRVISSSQRPLPDNTKHSQQTNIHAPDGIRTHNLSRRAAAKLRLRPRYHWASTVHNIQDKPQHLRASLNNKIFYSHLWLVHSYVPGVSWESAGSNQYNQTQIISHIQNVSVDRTPCLCSVRDFPYFPPPSYTPTMTLKTVSSVKHDSEVTPTISSV